MDYGDNIDRVDVRRTRSEKEEVMVRLYSYLPNSGGVPTGCPGILGWPIKIQGDIAWVFAMGGWKMQ